MAAAGGFTPNAFATVAHLQRQAEAAEPAAENLALFLALVGTARALLPLGRQVAKQACHETMKLWKKFKGDKADNIDMDAVVDQAEQEENSSIGSTPSLQRPRVRL